MSMRMQMCMFGRFFKSMRKDVLLHNIHTSMHVFADAHSNVHTETGQHMVRRRQYMPINAKKWSSALLLGNTHFERQSVRPAVREPSFPPTMTIMDMPIRSLLRLSVVTITFTFLLIWMVMVTIIVVIVLGILSIITSSKNTL